jgi:hypothetical protein
MIVVCAFLCSTYNEVRIPYAINVSNRPSASSIDAMFVVVDLQTAGYIYVRFIPSQILHASFHYLLIPVAISSAAFRLLGPRFQITFRTQMLFSCVCCVLSGRYLWYELITRLEDSYWMCVCVSNCVWSRNFKNEAALVVVGRLRQGGGALIIYSLHIVIIPKPKDAFAWAPCCHFTFHICFIITVCSLLLAVPTVRRWVVVGEKVQITGTRHSGRGLESRIRCMCCDF